LNNFFCNILFNNGDHCNGYYVSFSAPPDYDEDYYDGANDAYGVNDDQIFYYAPDGVDELEILSKPNPNNDFRILSYELEYKD
jgi:hypothetical protein